MADKKPSKLELAEARRRHDVEARNICWNLALQRCMHETQATAGKVPIPSADVILREADLIYRWFSNGDIPKECTKFDARAVTGKFGHA